MQGAASQGPACQPFLRRHTRKVDGIFLRFFSADNSLGSRSVPSSLAVGQVFSSTGNLLALTPKTVPPASRLPTWEKNRFRAESERPMEFWISIHNWRH